MKPTYETIFPNARGLSLVELLIAIALSAFLLFGVIQIFLSNKQTSTFQNSFGEIQESGRIASELIARDLRLAGHWGCAPSLADIDSKLDYTDVDVKDVAPGDALDPRGGLTIAHDVPVNTKVGDTIDTIDVKPGTDMITIRGAKALSNIRINAPMANASDTIKINSVDIGSGSVLLISDCQQGDIFTVVGATNGGTISHGETTPPGDIPNVRANLSKAYDQKAQLLRLFTRQYFVGKNPDNGYSLYLKENSDAPQEVVRNIEDLDFALSEDTNGDGSANRFDLQATAVANMDQVVSVKMSIYTESTNKNVSGGSPLTRVYSMTANLRNGSL